MIGGCTFARKAEKGDGYEYGIVEVQNYATKGEVRRHVVLGTADSLEEALAGNNMAAEGAPRIGVRHDEIPWREFG